MFFDVVVIGSGPAGCASAISCRQGNLTTLLITKSETNSTGQEHPSESIHPGVEPLLAKLNAAHCISKASKGVYEGIQQGEVYSPLGSDENGTWIGHHINRKLFDAELLKCVEEHGAQVLFNESFKNFITKNERVQGIETMSGKNIKAKYVIDASGYKRVAGKYLNLQEQFHSPPLVAWTGVSECTLSHPLFTNKFAKFLPHPDGWTWLAPELPGRCTWTSLAPKGKQDFPPPNELKDCTVVGEIKVVNRRWRIFRPLCKEGIILCGDAAAIIDPAAGQGVLGALTSGVVAAETIISIIKNPAFEAFYLASYDNWLSEFFNDKVEKLKRFYEEQGIEVLASKSAE